MIPHESVQVVIPALNEEEAIGTVVTRLRDRGFARIRVVDNGSDDATVERARAAGAETVVEPRRGYGQACWTGAQALPADVGWILFCDADGSDDLDDVMRFLAEAGSGVDFVLGDRRTRPCARAAMTTVQNFGNALSVGLVRLGWGHRYRDLGPLRLIRRSLYEDIAMRDRGFGWTLEMQVRAVEQGARIVELPVGYRRRQGGRSKISGTLKGSAQAGAIILSTIARLAWRRVPAGLLWAGALVFAGAALMAPHGEASALQVPWFLFGAAVMSLGFCLAWRRIKEGGPGFAIPAWWFWAVAVGARVLLIPMEPGDDVWRYFWEGRIQLAGHSPFLEPPNAPGLAALRPEWWNLINHREHTAIYPPMFQLLLRLFAATFGDALWAWKSVVVAADLAVCAALAARFGRAGALLFAWNPLVLYATAGGAHFESFLLLALVVAWRAWDQARWHVAAFAVGVSAGVKWITLPLIAWMAWRHRGNPARVVTMTAGALAPLAISVLWFRIEYGAIGDLWPREFVAGARGMDLAPWLAGLVIPALADSNYWIPFVFGPLAVAVLLRAQTFPGAAEMYVTLLLCFLPSVHPWYFVWLIPWAIQSANPGPLFLSVSAFVYFRVWQTHDLTGVWELSAWERLAVWLPFAGATLWWLWRRGDRRQAS